MRLSEQVLQVRAAAVTLWAVLTDGEVSVFREAPPAVRLLVGAQRRAAMISAFQADLSTAFVGS
ncbi:hypothetical protein [Methylobacterium sp. GC_Met_2]|uniref:hypothetical protein n=1 Tax=Methylobacterium sp. GC_Met_2 TaxID=2937376 RepID=UPI00226BA0E4|nr:hypothetical protein [Methylobacterium sp. GC_Met_2]